MGLVLDAIASPNSYPCQSVRQCAIDSFRFSIFITILLECLEGVWGISEGCLEDVIILSYQSYQYLVVYLVMVVYLVVYLVVYQSCKS